MVYYIITLNEEESQMSRNTVDKRKVQGALAKATERINHAKRIAAAVDAQLATASEQSGKPKALEVIVADSAKVTKALALATADMEAIQEAANKYIKEFAQVMGEEE